MSRPRIDWTAARLDYIEGRLESYAQVAEAYGANASYVGERALEEGWVLARKEYQARILETLLERGLEDKVEGARALLSIQYREAIDHLYQLREKRQEQGETWAPRDHKAHVEAFERVVGIARQALGLPRDFAPEQTPGALAPVVVAWLPDRARDLKDD